MPACPCLITTACHFPELAAAEGGGRRRPDRGCRDRGSARPARAIATTTRRLGQNGRRLVEAHYTWDRQAERLAEVYDWLAGGGAPPERGDVLTSDTDRRVSCDLTLRGRTWQLDCRSTAPVAIGTTQEPPICRQSPRQRDRAGQERGREPRRCLPALAWADEVFVVDSQSTDRHGKRSPPSTAQRSCSSISTGLTPRRRTGHRTTCRSATNGS